jgi:uncharacterized protein YdaT
MTTLTSIQLRPLLAELDAAFADAGKALQDAEHKRRIAVRRAILAGTYDESDATAAAVEAARQALHQAEIARDEATELLRDAVAREREAAEAQTRDELRAKVERIAELVAGADAAFADFLARFSEAQKLEVEARRLTETGLGQAAFGGAALPEALSDVASHVRSLRSGNPTNFADFATNRAAIGIQRIKTAAGI